VAVVERAAARFELDATHQRAGEGELFVLEPEAVHTGMAALPEGWAYKVLYIEPRLLHDWSERDGAAVAALRPHLRPGAPGRGLDRPEHAAVRRARRYLHERWDQRVTLAELARVFKRTVGVRPGLYARAVAS